MSTRFINNVFTEGNYYHIYNRGDRKLETAFHNDDKDYFLSLLDRYLSKNPSKMRHRKKYPSFYGKIRLHAFNLMDNHYHLLIELCVDDSMVIPRFMHCLIVSYTKYIGLKYGIVGTIFKGSYMHKTAINKVDSRVDENYVMTLLHYINSNKPEDLFSRYSTLYHWKNGNTGWLSRDLMFMHGDFEQYLTDLYEYLSSKSSPIR